MGWSLYTAIGYVKTYNTIKEAFDDQLQISYEEIEFINKKRMEEYGNDAHNISNIPIIKQQPFPNNEHIGNYTGGMLSFLNGIDFCIFEIPGENTNMHIIVLAHILKESHYIINDNVEDYYLGDKSWNDY